jgi:hypothetical protein
MIGHGGRGAFESEQRRRVTRAHRRYARHSTAPLGAILRQARAGWTTASDAGRLENLRRNEKNKGPAPYKSEASRLVKLARG